MQMSVMFGQKHGARLGVGDGIHACQARWRRALLRQCRWSRRRSRRRLAITRGLTRFLSCLQAATRRHMVRPRLLCGSGGPGVEGGGAEPRRSSSAPPKILFGFAFFWCVLFVAFSQGLLVAARRRAKPQTTPKCLHIVETWRTA